MKTCKKVILEIFECKKGRIEQNTKIEYCELFPPSICSFAIYAT